MRIGKILFIIPSLDSGGAEKQLVTLLSHLNQKLFKTIVVTYYPGGILEDAILSIPGVTLTSLNMKNKLDSLRLFFRLATIIRKEQPDILYGLLGDACTLAVLHSKMGKTKRSIMGLRATNMDFSHYSWTSGVIYRFNAFLSKYTDQVICNSWSGLTYHSGQGYEPNKIQVIPNGIDNSYFIPQPVEGAKLRAEWQISPDTFIIGRVGRIEPMKDYQTFLRSASILVNRGHDVHFVVAGKRDKKIFNELKSLCKELSITDNVLWLGHREDLPAIYSAFDMSTSASISEGTPNVVAESLSCQVPCVVTDVGDSRKILGPGGLCVPPASPDKLANAWEELLLQPVGEREKLGELGRKHISSHYSVKQMVKDTEQIFTRLL